VTASAKAATSAAATPVAAAGSAGRRDAIDRRAMAANRV